MESLGFALFALLPLGLASLFNRLPRNTAGFGFLAALAPVLASGLGSLIKGKQQSSAQKKQAAYEQQQAQAEEAAKRAQWESQQASPEAALRRQSFTMKLGKLLGKAGGRDKLPPSLLEAYDTGRRMPTYTPGMAYTPKPTGGAGIWDVLGGAGEALSYLDTSKLGGGKAPMSPGQPVSAAPAGGSFQTGQLAALLKKPPSFASGTKDFG